MNKSELIDEIAKKADLTKAKAAEAVDAFIGAVEKSLKKGQEVRLVGFGTFSITKRKAGTGRNPRTGEPLPIAARKIAKFKPGKGLKETINGGKKAA